MPEQDTGIVQLTADNFSMLKNEPLSLVLFGVSWSVTCNIQKSMIYNVYKVFRDKVFFGMVDTEISSGLEKQFVIKVLPSIVVFRNGEEIKRFEGIQRGKWLADYLNGITMAYPEDTDFRLMWNSLTDEAAEKRFLEKTILIIDDDPDSLFCLKTILENARFSKIDLAENISQVKECIERKRPDLVFLNARMRNKEGQRILKRLRSDASLSRIPLLVSVGDTKSAKSYEEVFQDAAILKHGRYLERPKTRQSFIGLVAHMLLLKEDELKEPPVIAIDSSCPVNKN